MKLIEWNINKRSNSKIITPSFVYQRIKDENADAICLVEYLEDQNLKNILEEDYYFAESFINSGNQVFIAVKKAYAPKGIDIIRKTEEKDCFNLLHIQFENYLNEIISIVGVRMLTGRGRNRINASLQTPPLNEYLGKITHKLICVGDFNIIKDRMAVWFPNYKTQTIKPNILNKTKKFNFIFPNKSDSTKIGSLVALDHVLAPKDIKVEAEYSWNFILDDNNYPYKDTDEIKIGNEYYMIKCGLPDHGMMICRID